LESCFRSGHSARPWLITRFGESRTANLIRKVESHYWWQGKIESAAEVLVIFKTTKGKLKALEKLIVAKHPYDTPEFLVVPIIAGNKRYLDWLSQSVRARNAQGPSPKDKRITNQQ